jgi:hypothetical protein
VVPRIEKLLSVLKALDASLDVLDLQQQGLGGFELEEFEESGLGCLQQHFLGGWGFEFEELWLSPFLGGSFWF